jgi:3',5'-nucleoside bisphosphate phosphatase
MNIKDQAMRQCGSYKLFRTDFHIHTCLSPCGDWDMTPRAVVEASAEKRIDIIAITDHNTMENAEAAMERGRELGITVLPGMEICSLEEVHILGLFETLDAARAMQEIVYDHLDGENKPDLFGYQVVANVNDEVTGQNPRMLIGATKLSLNDLVDRIHDTGGLAVAAHIDKIAYSIRGQLGFIPPDLPLDAVEVSFRTRPEDAGKELLLGQDLPCITSSDAHFINEIGRVSTKMLMRSPTIQEVRNALESKEGCKLVYSKKVDS